MFIQALQTKIVLIAGLAAWNSLPDVLHFTLLLSLIYLNAVSKLNFSREHNIIVTNFVSAPGRLCKWRYANHSLYIIIFNIWKKSRAIAERTARCRCIS